MDSKIVVTSPYCQAKLERLAREAGVPVELYATKFLERMAANAFSRVEKGSTYPPRTAPAHR